MLTLILVLLASTVSYLGFEVAIQTQKNITLHQWMHPSYYQNEFPEKDFPCKKDTDFYQAQVSQGYEHMQDKRVVITCLGRNIAHNLPTFKKRLEATGNLFKDYVVIIFENDSTKDNTRELLVEWTQQNHHIKLLELEGNKDCKLGLPEMYSYGSTSPTRIQKMSCFRNYCLNEVKNKYSNYDYMMVIDMDIKGPWSHDGIAHTMAQKDWDAVASYGLINMIGTAGQVLVMYDVLAYVPYQQEFNTQPGILDIGSDFFRFNFKELLSVKRGDDLIRVRSAFGGIAFYKIPSILEAEYVPTRCEHIGLHDRMTENGHGNIFMNPNMIILAGLQGPPNPFAEISIFPKKPASYIQATQAA